MVEDQPPAQAPALEDPEGFETLGDDLVLRACLRAPFMTHGSLHAVCQRFKSLLRPSPRLSQTLTCRAATMDGAIFLWGSDGSFQYRNAEWSEVAGGEVGASAACGTVLLG